MKVSHSGTFQKHQMLFCIIRKGLEIIRLNGQDIWRLPDCTKATFDIVLLLPTLRDQINYLYFKILPRFVRISSKKRCPYFMETVTTPIDS